MNKLITQTGTSGIVMKSPFGGADAPSNVASAITAKMREISEERAALGEKIDETNIDSAIAFGKKCKAIDNEARMYYEELTDAVFDALGCEAVRVQLAARNGRGFSPLSLRGKLSEIIKEINDAKNALKQPMPKHYYAMRLEISDDALKTICKALDKCDARYQIKQMSGKDAETLTLLFGEQIESTENAPAAEDFDPFE